jgi:Enoyl-CoA hydratase/isomerase
MWATSAGFGGTPKFMSIWRSPKPVIAQVHGWCVGAGRDMALCADLVIASEGARIGTPYSRMWGAYLSGMWLYRLGLTRAKEYTLTGKPLAGDEAEQVGLINRAVPFARLEAEVSAQAAQLASIPLSQLAAMKLIVNQAYENMGLASAQTLGLILDGLMRNTPDARRFVDIAARDGVWLAYKASRDDLDATKKAAKDQIRPLLIDVTPIAPLAEDLDANIVDAPDGQPSIKLAFPGGDWVEIDARCVYVGFEKGRAFFAVPLRNVGRGLAVIDPSAVTVKGEGLSREPLGCEVQRERIPPGETTRVLCTHEQAPQDKPPNKTIFEMRVPYKDLDESQTFEAAVFLERETEDHWRVRDVKQVALTPAITRTTAYSARPAT